METCDGLLVNRLRRLVTSLPELVYCLPGCGFNRLRARFAPSPPSMKVSATLERYYVLPCCLLLLNLCNEIISYKARMIHDGLLRTFVIMGLVLFGASLVAFVVAPGLMWVVQSLRRTSRSAGGGVGEIIFLTCLGFLIFWLYYRNYIIGTEAIVPPFWRNPLLR
jgi:hypothetical protein